MTTNTGRILLVEDDVNLGSLLKEYLKAKGYTATLETDGEKGYRAFKKDHFDLCILDIMLPVKDGFTLARDIRIQNADIPIIFLTAKSMKTDVLEGFRAGADDYLTKPFSMEELLLRIEAVLRRSARPDQTSLFILGKYVFDTNRQLLTSADKTINLTTKESDLLKMLCQYPNQVLERNYALKSIWKDDNYFNARSMDVYITKIRKHLSDEPAIQIINVHGKGYKLLREQD
jgi:DNA-binding response OmpR family regulator